mgnify:CR=1 FL=1
MGKNSRTWTKARDSDAAHEIASFHNLDAQDRDDQGAARADRAEPGERLGVPEEARRPQSLRAVRRRASARCTSRKPERQGRPRSCGSRGARACSASSPRPTSRARSRRSRSTAGTRQTQGSDHRHARLPARSPGSTGKSAGAAASTRFVRDPDKQPTLRLRQPVFTQAEADQRAEGRAQRAREAVPDRRGRGDRPAGDPPRSQRRSSTISARRSRRPTTSSRRRTRSTANGYRTRFKVKETGL